MNDKHKGWAPDPEWLTEHHSMICPNPDCKRVKSVEGYCRSCSYRDPNTGDVPVEATKATRLPGIKTNEREVVTLGGSRKEWDEGLRPANLVRSETKDCKSDEPDCKQPDPAPKKAPRKDPCLADLQRTGFECPTGSRRGKGEKPEAKAVAKPSRRRLSRPMPSQPR